VFVAAGGIYSAPPDPSAGFGGCVMAGRRRKRGRGRKGRKGEGMAPETAYFW